MTKDKITISARLLAAVAKWAYADHTHRLSVVLFRKGECIACDGHRWVRVECPTKNYTLAVSRRHVLATIAASDALESSAEVCLSPFGDSEIAMDVGLEARIIVVRRDHVKYPSSGDLDKTLSATPPTQGPSGYSFNPTFMADMHEVNLAMGANGVQCTAWADDRTSALLFDNGMGAKFAIMPLLWDPRDLRASRSE